MLRSRELTNSEARSQAHTASPYVKGLECSEVL